MVDVALRNRGRTVALVVAFVLLFTSVAFVAGVKAADTSTPAVFIASGENYPDGLVSGSAAAVSGAPVLLTRKDSLPTETIAELVRLNPDKIYIAGGTAAISATVETQLAAYGTVIRLSGANRYATAAAISAAIFPATIGGIPGPAGPAGADGTNGTNGTDGVKGDKGDPGTNGTDGTDGTDGVKGDKGDPGTNGTDGTDGTDGVKGDKGDPGTNGTDGADGTDGTDGTNGLPGADGTDGTDGTNGLPGADGTDGTDGTNGLPGADGTDGTDGTNGTDGVSGLEVVKAATTFHHATPGTVMVAIAHCPADKKVTGGGAYVDGIGAADSALLIYSYPSFDQSSWEVGYKATKNSSLLGVHSYAICANVP